MFSLDTETTGVDFRHGARPFFVTVCGDDGGLTYWEWDVDPLTRRPAIPAADLAEIRNLLQVTANWGAAHYDEETRTRYRVVGQNLKFDAAALASVGITNWPWHMTEDTLVAGHLLASNRPHDLTSMALEYLGEDILPLEETLGECVKECRRLCRRNDFVAAHGAWAMADHDRPGMPSCPASNKGKAGRGEDRDAPWKMDMWLPRAVAKAQGLPEPDPDCTHTNEKGNSTWVGRVCTRCKGHQYWVALSDYSNADSGVTLALWRAMEPELRQRRHWALYRESMILPRIVGGMETRGVTAYRPNLVELRTEYTEASTRAAAVCKGIARDYGYDLELPKNGVNASLREFCFNKLKLEHVRNAKAKTDAPTLNKEAMGHYLLTLPRRSKELLFVRTLLDKRQKDTALQYLAGYERFWLPLDLTDCAHPDWFVLHPSLNQTGSDTLRFSSSNPNSQNISKKEVECRQCEGEGCGDCDGTGKSLRSLRYCFGPAPGREWWSIDAKGIEDRLPAYESGQQELVGIFEEPDKPPYYGSNHLLRFHTVYPDVWEKELREVGFEKVGPHCKKKYASTYYVWCKNGGFAVQYGAVDKAAGWGTADRAFHKRGAHKLLKERFSKLEALNQKWIKFAERHGYVETIPDKSVDPARGYPILCSRTEYNKILETVPLNYHIQGSAMWWTRRAMVRVQGLFDEWNREPAATRSGGYHITLQVHDELVLDLPKATHPLKDPAKSNLGRIREVCRLMEQGGKDYGIPTPVGAEYNERNWSEGVVVAV